MQGVRLTLQLMEEKMENLNNSTVNEEVVEETTQEEVKTYTQEEVLKLIQSESDRAVTKALKTQQKKYEKQLSLSKLDGDEREKAEKDTRIAELEEQLRQFEVERNKSEIKSVLASRGLSIEYADILAITDDVEANQRIIEKLHKLHKADVRAGIEARIAGTAPKGNGASAPIINKDTVKNMSVQELQQLKNTNPELYRNLYN